MESTVIVTRESKDLLVEAETLALQYETYKVFDNITLLSADKDLTAIKKKRGAIEEARLKISRKMDETKRDVMKPYVDAVVHLDSVREIINTEMSAYRKEQERIARVEQERLAEIARKAEETERKKLEARAENAIASGKIEKAEELIEKAAAVFVPVPVVRSTVVETKNKPRQVWKFRVKDANAIPRDYLVIDEVKIGGVVRSTKGTLAIPGIEIYSEDSRF